MAPKKRHPLEMDALPVPRDWVPSAWFKAYNAADSQFYNAAGKDCIVSKRKRDSGETRERALTFWAKYPVNKAWKTKMERKEMEEEEEEEEEGEEEEGEEEEEEEEDGDEDEDGDEEEEEVEDEGDEGDEGDEEEEEEDEVILVLEDEQDGVDEVIDRRGEEHLSDGLYDGDGSEDEAYGFWYGH